MKQELIEEENNLTMIKRVFGSAEGFEILDWIISDLCNFWTRSVAGLHPWELGRYEVGRALFNRVTLADPSLAFQILEKRRRLAESIRQEEFK